MSSWMNSGNEWGRRLFATGPESCLDLVVLVFAAELVGPPGLRRLSNLRVASGADIDALTANGVRHGLGLLASPLGELDLLDDVGGLRDLYPLRANRDIDLLG